MLKPRHRCLVCGDPLNQNEWEPQRWFTCGHDCYLLYKSWKAQGKLPGHKVRLTPFQRKGDMAQATKRAKRGFGAISKAAALAQEFIEPDRKPPPRLTPAELEHRAKWKAIREEWAREDTAEAKPKFPRRF